MVFDWQGNNFEGFHTSDWKSVIKRLKIFPSEDLMLWKFFSDGSLMINSYFCGYWNTCEGSMRYIDWKCLVLSFEKFFMCIIY